MKDTNYKVQKVGNAMNMDFGPVLDLLVKVSKDSYRNGRNTPPLIFVI